jgi:hypothetical protein
VLAVTQAVCVALFQLLSKVLVLVAMLLLRLIIMCLPAIGVVGVLRPRTLPMVGRVAGAALVNCVLVGALAGLHALLVVALLAPDSGVDLWLALLITGVTTVVLWAVARPFRRLVSMVSLTHEQFGGVVPGAGDGPMSRVWRRMRGSGGAEERQQRWWNQRRAEAGAGVDGPGLAEPGVPRPESVAVVGTARALPPPGEKASTGGGSRRFGGVGRPYPYRAEPDETDDQVIYRRPDAEVDRSRREAVQPELVEGVPVYRIYRPAYPGGGRAG